jgi:hypothetical protein
MKNRVGFAVPFASLHFNGFQTCKNLLLRPLITSGGGALKACLMRSPLEQKNLALTVHQPLDPDFEASLPEGGWPKKGGHPLAVSPLNPDSEVWAIRGGASADFDVRFTVLIDRGSYRVGHHNSDIDIEGEVSQVVQMLGQQRLPSQERDPVPGLIDEILREGVDDDETYRRSAGKILDGLRQMHLLIKASSRVDVDIPQRRLSAYPPVCSDLAKAFRSEGSRRVYIDCAQGLSSVGSESLDLNAELHAELCFSNSAGSREIHDPALGHPASQ